MRRITSSNQHLPAVQRGKPLQVTVDGRALEAYQGETIAAVLVANGIWQMRQTSKRQEKRGLYCGMGVCYECLVTVNGEHAVRACMTLVADGMQIETCKEVQL